MDSYGELKRKLVEEATRMEGMQLTFWWHQLLDRTALRAKHVRYIAARIRQLNDALPAHRRDPNLESRLDDEVSRHAREYAEGLLDRVRKRYIESSSALWEELVADLRGSLRSAGLTLEKLGSSNQEIASIRKKNRRHGRISS
jgi:hypothetical protein